MITLPLPKPSADASALPQPRKTDAPACGTLVVSRNAGEDIRIGDDIVVHVIETGRGRMKLMVRAPKNVKILRGELLRRRSAPVRPQRAA